MKRKFDAACRQYQVKEAGLENLWTTVKSWPLVGLYFYDEATQTYIIPASTTAYNHTVNVHQLPTPIPPGTPVSITVFIDSGRYEAGSGYALKVCGFDSTSSELPLACELPPATDLTGMILKSSSVTTKPITHFMFMVLGVTATETIRFRVMLVIGDTPADTFKPHGVGQNEWADGLKSGFPSVKMFGKTEQRKWDGKNLFPVIPNTTANGVTLTLMDDGGYTLDGTCTAAANFVLRATLSPGTYTLSCVYEGAALPNDYNPRAHVYNETTPSESASIPNMGAVKAVSRLQISQDSKVQFRIRIQTGYAYNHRLYPLLVRGEFTPETMPEFEPYNAVSPSLQYPAEVKVNNATVRSLGKNLFNPESTDYIARNEYNNRFLPKYENGIYYPPGEAGDGEQAMLCIPVEAGAAYTLSYEVAVGSPSWGNVFALSGKNNRIVETHVQLKGGVIPTPYTFTIPDGYEYVGIAPAYNTTRYEVGLKNIQLEKGAVATAYEPYYDGGEATAPNLMCAVDGSCQSTYDSQTGEFVNWWDKFIFDGSEAWSAIATNDGQHHGFYVSNVLSERAIGAAYWSNQASPQVGYKALDGTPGFRFSEIYYHTLTAYDFGFYDGALKDKGVANWKAHLAAHPLEVWVARSEPEITNIGPQRLTCPTGYGRIIQVAGDIPDSPLEIKYLAHGGNVK